MKTSGSPTVLGSESCNAIEHVKTNCSDQSDYTVTKLALESNDTLVLQQNPRNVLKVKFPQFDAYNQTIEGLLKNKVETTFVIDTTDGLGGGGDLTGTKITLTLKPNDPHIHLDRNGIYIEEFTDVETSGTVPSPTIKDEKHYLTSKGTWVTLSQIEYKGEINLSTGFPNPKDLAKGWMYKIADLGDPNATIENSYDGKTYKSEDVLLWGGLYWIVIGKTSVKVNLSKEADSISNTIINSAGEGVVLTSATSQVAGLLSASDKESISSFKGVKSLNSFTHIDEGLNLNYIDRTFESRRETNKTLLLPLATDTTNGLLGTVDKIKLNNLPNIISRSSLEYTESTLNLVNSDTDIDSGITSTTKIPLPLSTYTEGNFKDGLISGQNTKKLEGISGMLTLMGYEYNIEQLRITFQKYNANSGDLISDYFILPTATKNKNGLLSFEDKIKLDQLVVMEQKQADYDNTDPEDVSFIRNKPVALTSTGVKHALVPSTLGVSDKQYKILNANGEWVDSTMSKPVITVSTSEPTDPSLRVDGAIWIKIPKEKR